MLAHLGVHGEIMSGELMISGYYNVQRYADRVGFSEPEKSAKLAMILSLRQKQPYHEYIESITQLGVQSTFDVTVAEVHEFSANCVRISNCAEKPLGNGDVCNLGSINLSKFVTNGTVDYSSLRRTVAIATRMLDSVIDVTSHEVEFVNKTMRGNRQIGLGVMGFADMLIAMRVPYGSAESCEIATTLIRFIEEEANATSELLAAEKGAFPNYADRNPDIIQRPRRNSYLTTIPPTGTTSLVAGVCSGIEPYFALCYYHKSVLGGHASLQHVIKPLLTALETDEECKRSGVTIEEIIAHGGASLRDFTRLPEWVRRVFVTAMDISPEAHIGILCAWQKYCGSAISKTINLPNNSTIDDVRKAYFMAWKGRAKSAALYREGSRQFQVLNIGTSSDAVGSTSIGNNKNNQSEETAPSAEEALSSICTVGGKCG